jgi:hypothetical protein
MDLRMQPRNENFFTLFSKAGSNVVESAANLMEFAAAPHERRAELAKRTNREGPCRPTSRGDQRTSAERRWMDPSPTRRVRLPTVSATRPSGA